MQVPFCLPCTPFCTPARDLPNKTGGIHGQFEEERGKIRQIESALARGTDIPLPTKTPIATVVTAYVEQLRAVKLERNAQRDIYYLREAFGPICPALKVKNPKISEKGKKRPTSGKRWHPDNFAAQLREINSTKGLKWSCLDYRHTFGSQLAMEGESLYKISKLMGEFRRKFVGSITLLLFLAHSFVK